MFRKLWQVFFAILNRNRIPPLPRGMLATAYEDIPSPERRVLARLGARDPIGVKVAMRQHDAKTLEELVSKLKHYSPQRNLKKRLDMAIGRILGGFPTDPHRADILRDERHSRQSMQQKDIEQRVKRARKAFREMNR